MEHSLDAAIRAEADDLLYNCGLLQTLTKYCDVLIMGSYALRLMAWRDLDLWMDLSSVSRAKFLQLGADVGSRFSPSEMHFHDYEVNPTPEAPAGLYWRVHLGNILEEGWRLDLWALPPSRLSELSDRSKAIESQLTDENRQHIIEIKSHCWRDPHYGYRYSSQDIYAAVLEGGVRDTDAFQAWLEKSRHLTSDCT